MSPARYIRQINVEKKIICHNYNNISEHLNGITGITVRWFSDGVGVFVKKGKLPIFTRVVIGRVVFSKFKGRKFKKNE